MAAAEEEVSPFFQGAVEEAAGDQLRFCASVQCSLTADHMATEPGVVQRDFHTATAGPQAAAAAVATAARASLAAADEELPLTEYLRSCLEKNLRVHLAMSSAILANSNLPHQTSSGHWACIYSDTCG